MFAHEIITFFFFFLNDRAPTEIYTLPLHAALPISNDPKRSAAVLKVINGRLQKARQERPFGYLVREAPAEDVRQLAHLAGHLQAGLFITKFRDRKSTRLNSSHLVISYAVFCLKKKQ